ncbi:MAG: hypothetical protein A2827_00970 [Candidatus Spechtbacteria bacterium RIFCSPHIGHO2_01_FULL_43_30]|uniref:Glycosyltransferase RgtA/B/C/D-like domain-containing protein n=1 Tax=Candidatus Spechtbacteria bacterium RIFCSPHIGHO2_01_FULL_43_30 TaxID=1802158 RepID=A0A1G2H4K3_9BACT|nr:MAG: hypothetical protein A2827_00970 [Candidatus Spechtbacteria bacterium RIFCSPHIGHO2_01_FULL_43_30]
MKNTSTIALLLLGLMGFIAINSIKNDSATTDEAPHITSGYAYLKLQDLRLNPEHPPLLKDIAAFPLLFMDLNFPYQNIAWTQMVNAQWNLAPEFLYNSGNNADEIIFWGRTGPILLMLLFGWFVFRWSSKLFGDKWGLFCLSLFVFSPDIMAHGRLITTDTPAAFAFLSAIYFYIKLLKSPTNKNLIIFGVVFAIAQLTKFSLLFLFIFLPLITILWIITANRTVNVLSRPVISDLFAWILRFCKIFLISLAIITVVYHFHIINYPIEKQIEDISHILSDEKLFTLKETLVWMADKPLLRGLAQYVLGASMVFLRVQGGSTAYFLGETSAQSWFYYFPVVFILKVPAAVLVFIALSAILFLKSILTNLRNRNSLHDFTKNNFDELAMLLFVSFYWVISINTNLNIGIRHILPSFPFIYILIAGQLKRWLNSARIAEAKTPILLLENLPTSVFSTTGKTFLIASLVMMNAATFVMAYPHYLSYFNIFSGGSDNAYKYVVDSNLDWGQDLKRLAQFVEENNINQIKVDYFGGGNVKYYLGDKAILWNSNNGETTGWIAVSATYYQTSRAYAGFSYKWLDKYEPVKKIGHSIFVYNIEH